MSDATLTLLTSARDYYAEHGGALGAARNDNGRVCAIGALLYCSESNTTAALAGAQRALDNAAERMYDADDIIDLNDSITTSDNRRALVLNCYAEAIWNVSEGESE